MLVIDRFSRKAIYEQIVEGIEREILTLLLTEGEQLPSLRELSASLSINPNTIQKAYMELDRRGVIASAPGRGYFVAPGAQEIIRSNLSKKLEDIESTAYELALAAIPKEQVMAAVDDAYKRAHTKGNKGGMD